MSSPVSPLSNLLIFHLISLLLRQFHHLPVFLSLHSNSFTSLPSGVFNYLSSLASLYSTPPSHFLLTLISCSIIIEQQPSCLPPIWIVFKSQQTHISLLSIHKSPFSMTFTPCPPSFIFPLFHSLPLHQSFLQHILVLKFC